RLKSNLNNGYSSLHQKENKKCQKTFTHCRAWYGVVRSYLRNVYAFSASFVGIISQTRICQHHICIPHSSNNNYDQRHTAQPSGKLFPKRQLAAFCLQRRTSNINYYPVFAFDTQTEN